MWESKKDQIRRLKEQLDTLRANESARSILPMSFEVDDLSVEASARAAALQAARKILGDITTDELLDAADFIADGTRYNDDGDEIERDDEPVFDEWIPKWVNPTATERQAAWYASGTEFADREKPLHDAIQKRINEMKPAWEQLLKTATGEQVNWGKPLPRRDVGATFPLWAEAIRRGRERVAGSDDRKDTAKPYFDHDAGEMIGHDEMLKRQGTGRPPRLGDSPLLGEPGELVDRVTTTPLVPVAGLDALEEGLDAEASTRLAELRAASAVGWVESDTTYPDETEIRQWEEDDEQDEDFSVPSKPFSIDPTEEKHD